MYKNKIYERQKYDDRPEVVTFTRRDRNAKGDEVTIKRIATVSVKCSSPPRFSNQYMSCKFKDDLGTEKKIQNIVFTNFDVKDQKFTTYKESDSGKIVTKVNFNNPTICEILGHNNIGLTMNCRGAERDNSQDEMQYNRSRGGW